LIFVIAVNSARNVKTPKARKKAPTDLA